MGKSKKMTPLERLRMHLDKANSALAAIERSKIEQLSFTDAPVKAKEVKKKFDYKKVMELWNAQGRLVKTKKLNETLKRKIADILTEYTMEEVEECFVKYNTILGDGYWFEYDKWTLTSFLKSNNGFEKIYDNPMSFYENDKKKKTSYGNVPTAPSAPSIPIQDVAPTIMMELALYANKEANRDLDYYNREMQRLRKRDTRFNVYEHYDKIKEGIDPLVKQKIDRLIKYNT